MKTINIYADEMYPVWYIVSDDDAWTGDYTATVDEKELEQFYEACQNFHKWQDWLESKKVKNLH